jgi:hypothetical protein
VFHSRQRKDFSLLHSVESGPGAHPVSCIVGALSLGVKRPVREADDSPPSSSEAKNDGAISPLPQMSSWRGA